MAYEVIAQGTGLGSWNALTAYSNQFSEGDLGELRLELRYPLPAWMVSALENGARSAGADLWDNFRQDGSTLYIRCREGAPWLAIIVLVLAGIAVVLVVRWTILKVTGGTGEPLGNVMFAAATALPVLVTGFGPSGGRKKRATGLLSLMMSGYVYHYLGSRGALPKTIQELYDQLMGRLPGLPPPGNGPGPEPPPGQDVRITNLRFFADSAVDPTYYEVGRPGYETVHLWDGRPILPSFTFTYQGPASTLWIGIGFAPASWFPWFHNDIFAWAGQQVSFQAATSPQTFTVAIRGPSRWLWPPTPRNAGYPLAYGQVDCFKTVREVWVTEPRLATKGVYYRDWDDNVYRYTQSFFD